MEKRYRGMRRFCAAAVAIVLFMTGAFSQTQVKASGPVVRVGVFELKGFFEKDNQGNPIGYGFDYLAKVAEMTGWTCEYVWTENWDECVEYLREGRVDMVAPAQKTKQRMQEFDFSSFDIGMECGTLLALSTSDWLIYEDFSTFDEITIGCVQTLVFREAFIEYGRENGFKPSFAYYKDTKAVMAALNAGEVDAVLANIFAKTDTTKVLAKFGVAPFYFMVGRESSSLMRQLNDALQRINIEFSDFETGLMDKYYPAFNNIPFTRDELEYIQNAPVLKVACRTNIKPISYVDEKTGEIEGITRRILEQISANSGLEFEYTAIPQGAITYDYFWENDISLISSVEYSKENLDAPGISLTSPYLNSKKVFVCRPDMYFDVDKPMKLAIATGSATLIQTIEEQYPGFELLIYSEVEECFEAVRRGKADALLQNQYVVTDYLVRPQYADLVTVPVEGFDDMLCLSPVVNRDVGVADEMMSDPRLISILNKAIRQISENDLSKLIIKQTSEGQYQFTIGDFVYQNRYMLIVSSVILVILLLILLYSLRLKRRNNRLIAESEAKLRYITNNINGGVLVLTGEDILKITYANKGFLKLLHCSKEEYERIQNQEYSTYVHPDDRDILREIMSKDVNTDNRISVKLRIIRGDGSYVPALFNGTIVEHTEGNREIYCVIMDISEQEKLMEKISLEQKKQNILIESSGDIIFGFDCQNMEFTISSLFQEKYGWKKESKEITNVIFDILNRLKIHEEDWEQMRIETQRVFDTMEKGESQVRIRKAEGGSRWCRILQYPMMDAYGNLVNVIGRIIDIDQEVRERVRLEKKSRTDALTGLLNKEAFYKEARKFLESGNDKNSALIFIDIDNFKKINDQLGHMTGDYAIKQTAKKLQIIFSNYDLIARFGGDEFCILLKEISMETLKDKLEWTVEKLKASYSAEGESVSSSASIGAVCTEGRRTDLEVLLECADKALYCVKERGKNGYMIYGEMEQK